MGEHRARDTRCFARPDPERGFAKHRTDREPLNAISSKFRGPNSKLARGAAENGGEGENAPRVAEFARACDGRGAGSPWRKQDVSGDIG
jgi:hypothetical protein